MLNLFKIKALRISTAFLLVTFLILPGESLSDIAGSLRDMFNDLGLNSGSSEAGTYYSQSRGYIMGGSVTARTGTRSMTPAVFQVPDLRAGCGGIDMFFGGFQFINAEEFKRFLQAAGTAAIGYAFHMALENVCPTCNSILKDLRQAANAINKFGLDSCTAGRALVNTTLGPMFEGYNKAIAEYGQNTSGEGTSDSMWSPVKGWLEASSKSLSDLTRKVYEMAKDPTRSSVPSRISTMTKLRRYALSEDEMEIAISLLGTKAPVVIQDPDTGEYIPYAQCTEYGSTVNLSDLLGGATASNPLRLYRCSYPEGGSLSDGTCESIEITDNTSFEGYRKMSYDRIVSIRDKVQENTPLTDSEKQFLAAIPNVPVISALRMSVYASPGLSDMLIMNLADVAAASYAMNTVLTFVNLYRNGAGINDCSDDTSKRLFEVYDALLKEYDRYMKQIDNINKIGEFIAKIEHMNISYASKKVYQSMLPVKF